MSSPMNQERNEMLPPPKRQRTLAGGNHASQRSTQSRSVSAPCSHQANGSSSALSPSRAINSPLNDDGPIFTNVQEIDGGSSIEAALGVPSRILFRQVGGDCKASGNVGGNKRRLRPLMSRQEAEQFLRLTLLAQEIDVLVDLSETVLEKRQFARRFRRDVLMQDSTKSTPNKDPPWKNPWLSTLGPILDVLEQRKATPSNQTPTVSNPQQNSPEDILHYIHNELTRLYHALQTCGIYELERSAEQNRSLVASLTDILGYTVDTDVGPENGRTSAVANLANEKESLSKLQDLLAKRVRSLLVVLCHSNTTSTTESNDASDEGEKMGAQGIHNQQILFDEQLSSRSGDGDTENIKDSTNNDDSSILSLGEVLKPLEVVCDELFGQPTNDTTPTTASKQNETENGDDKSLEVEATNGDFAAVDTTEEDPDPMAMVPLEMSQRTVGAAATILSLASDPKQDVVDGNENDTTQTATFSEKDLNHSYTRSTGEPEASQRAVGAANTMVALATKPKDVPNNGDHRTVSTSTTNRSDPQMPQHRGDDDDSYIEDPPSDGEMESKESPKKDEAANGRVGIFDVVDVLTPASQS